MKKIIALTLVVISVCLALVGCSNPSYDTALRWNAEGEGETYVYNIYLAGRVLGMTDYEGDAALIDATKYDQHTPVSAEGTYTVNVKQSSDNANYHVLTTTLDLYENYLIDESDIEQSFIEQAVNDGLATLPSDNVVRLHTTITSSCSFDPNKVAGGLRAINSTRTVSSFYVGKIKRDYNNYKIDCNYDYSGKKYTCQYTIFDLATDTQRSQGSIKFTSSSNAPIYDNNLLWLALRTYIPSQMTNGLSINFIEPMLFPTKPTALTVKSVEDYGLMLNDNRTGKFSVYTVTGGVNLIMAVDTINEVSVGGAPRKSFVPVKMQQGYLAYVLQDAYLDALGYPVAGGE